MDVRDTVEKTRVVPRRRKRTAAIKEISLREGSWYTSDMTWDPIYSAAGGNRYGENNDEQALLFAGRKTKEKRKNGVV